MATLANEQSGPVINRVPPTWLEMPPGPARDHTIHLWTADELRAWGKFELAAQYASYFCPDWRTGSPATVKPSARQAAAQAGEPFMEMSAISGMVSSNSESNSEALF